MTPDRCLFAHQHVAVVGTAPGCVLPAHYDVTVCANAGPRVVVDAGARPDVQVVTGYMTSLAHRSPANVDALAGLHLPQVWVLETFQGIESVRAEYATRGITYDAIHRLEQEEWAGIVEEMCGLPLGRHVVDGSDYELSVSTGLFSVCFAFYAGAERVTVCGVSMDVHREFHRPHLTGDRQALHALHARFGDRMSTTSPQMAIVLKRDVLKREALCA